MTKQDNLLAQMTDDISFYTNTDNKYITDHYDMVHEY